jgi:hypothetical protein
MEIAQASAMRRNVRLCFGHAVSGDLIEHDDFHDPTAPLKDSHYGCGQQAWRNSGGAETEAAALSSSQPTSGWTGEGEET